MRRAITVAAGQIRARLMNEASATLADLEFAIQQAAQQHADLLVLPECAYPAYLVGSVVSYRAGAHLSSEAFIAWLGAQAAQHRMHMVCGLVEGGPTGLHNAAIVMDDQGREIGRSRKQFLWNADHDWYLAGDEIRVFETDVGRIGVAICAETRVPEILATLAGGGAEFIAVPTCWVNHARQPRQYANPQVEFMMEARAREFGIPFVCADKWGLELAATGYVGQSRIIRADGTLAAAAPADADAVITAPIVPAPPPSVPMSDAWRARLLEEVRVVARENVVEEDIVEEGDRPGDRSARSGHEPTRREGVATRPSATTSARRITVAAIPTVVTNERLADGTGESLFEPLQEQGVCLLLANVGDESSSGRLESRARAFGMRAIGFPARADVFEWGPVRVGCVSGQQACSFAASRVLALDGAELLLYFNVPDDLATLRSRAAENRVFVLVANQRSAMIIAPDGAVLERSEENQPSEVVAEIDLAEATPKLVASKTDIFAQRRPALYRF